MSNHPLVTAIVPVFNGEKVLSEALDSVFVQDYRPLEVIVIDDGSTDGSSRIATSYPQVRYFYQPNQGLANARNTGIAASCGEFIAFLDADDIWLPGKITSQVTYLLQNRDIGYTITRMRLLIANDTGPHPYLQRNHFAKEPPCLLPSALLVRRTVLDQTGGFDERRRLCEDADWFLRASDAGISRATIPEVLLERRIHSSNGSTDASIAREPFAALRSSVRRKREAGEA